MQKQKTWQARLPFYYGWVIITVAFVTMAVSVSARTAFSLLLPPLIDEFGWERGLAAGAFSFGFLMSAIVSPFVGRAMDRRGPRLIIGAGVALVGVGLIAAPAITYPWQLYLTLGGLVGVGANLMSFTAHSLFLPHWFVRHRGLAISIAFSGVGIGAVVLLPWFQAIILNEGWRAACVAMGTVVIICLGPLTLLVRHRPADVGLLPDGEHRASGSLAPRPGNIVDHHWASIEWTVARAVRTTRFWLIIVAYFCALFAWYAVQVHQTKYLVEVGFTPIVAAWALGFVSVIAIPGQIALGALSDRIGREWVWTVACAGFAICYAALIAVEQWPSMPLLYVIVISQGFLGYALTSVMGPIVAEIFEGPHYGSIFGVVTVALMAGGAAGPWVAGIIHDRTGSYAAAFYLAMFLCAVSAAAVWIAAPRKVRSVHGRNAAAARPDPDGPPKVD